jgi:hypothetical protein
VLGVRDREPNPSFASVSRQGVSLAVKDKQGRVMGIERKFSITARSQTGLQPQRGPSFSVGRFQVERNRRTVSQRERNRG